MVQNYPNILVVGTMRGTVTYRFFNGSNREIYTLILSIIPKPPIIEKYSVVETRDIPLYSYGNTLSMNRSDIVSVYYGNIMYIR